MSEGMHHTAATGAQPHRFGGLARAPRQVPATQSIPALVGAVFGTAPPELRVKMLEHLLRPLGLLSVAAVAGGAFAKIRFRTNWPDMKIRTDDVVGVKAAEVTSLVEHVMQVDERAVDGLTTVLQAWPMVRDLEAPGRLIQLLEARRPPDLHCDANRSEPVWH